MKTRLITFQIEILRSLGKAGRRRTYFSLCFIVLAEARLFELCLIHFHLDGNARSLVPNVPIKLVLRYSIYINKSKLFN